MSSQTQVSAEQSASQQLTLQLPEQHWLLPPHESPNSRQQTQSSSTSPSQSLSSWSQISTMLVSVSLTHSTPSPPAVQVQVPFSQLSVSAPSQGRSLVLKSSSAEPSQSSSRPLHNSTIPAGFSLTHSTVRPLAVHVHVPFSQLSVSAPSQGTSLVEKSSSTEPSQSLSRPSQISTIPVTVSLTHSTPEPSAVHVQVPFSQSSVSAPSQERSFVSKSSSTEPSQLSSMPLQTSTIPAGSSFTHSTARPSAVQVKLPFSH